MIVCNMGVTRSKRIASLIFCFLECLLFSGILHGWMWLNVISLEDSYFVDLCNITNQQNADLKPITTTTVRPRRKCRKRKPRQSQNVLDMAEKNDQPEIVSQHTLIDKELVVNTTEEVFIDYYGIRWCDESEEQMEMFVSIVFVCRDLLIIVAGWFFDKFGTTRTRLLMVFLFALGTLLMTFSSSAFPWLLLPALILTSLAGFMTLLTNVQVGNLFDRWRYTVMSFFVGGYYSSGIVFWFMKLTHPVVNIQTSSMFLTTGIVPMLIFTIALLPKTIIPWPLPSGYGHKRNKSLDGAVMKQQRAWQRPVGMAKQPKVMPKLFDVMMRSIYIFSIVMFSVLFLKNTVFTINVREILSGITGNRREVANYREMYGFLQLLGIILSPIHGFIMDKHVTPSVDISPRTQQMANILNGIIVLLVVAVVDSILTMVPSLWAIIVVFILQSYLKAAALSTVFAFVTHVHFPQIHYGKLVGASLFCANIVGLLQYPMREFIQHDSRENIIHVQIIFICLLLVSTIHPVNVWRHCRDGLIKDMSVCELERRRKSVTETLIRRLSIDSRPSITYDDTCRDTTIAEIADTLL